MRHLLLTLFLGVVLTGYTQSYNQDLTLKLWDNTTAPHSNNITDREYEMEPNRPTNISEATLFVFKANPATATGQAIVLCPGGGYKRLAMDHEGYQMAQWLAQNGVTVAVLKYRMPNGCPEVPLEDAVKAIETMKSHACEWGFDPEKVGIAGCSAGGHLAAMCSTKGTIRPAFTLLFYPVITSEAGLCHKGSFDNLLGTERTAEKSQEYSLERCVDKLTPPALLLLSDDDRSVPSVSSTRYYNALKAAGQRASMHIYPTGGHGWGMRDSFSYKNSWQEQVLDWLKEINSTLNL